jgi:hypothetical protein
VLRIVGLEGVMCLFVAIVYAIAWMVLDRRDA